MPWRYNSTLLSCRCTEVLYISMILSRISIKVLSRVVFSVAGIGIECVTEDEGVAESRKDKVLMRDTGDARAVFKSSKQTGGKE